MSLKLPVLLWILCVSAVPAAAQQPEGRYSIWLSAAAQAAMPAFDERLTFEMYEEDAIVQAGHRAKATLLVDGGAGVRLRGNLGAGFSISRFSRKGRADIVAQIPYPFDFNRFREVSGASSDLDHTELAYHAQLLFSWRLERRLRLVLSAGPAVLNVRRQLIENVEVDEAYPYDTATFRSAGARVAKGTGVGFHAGADLAWIIGRHAGIGALVRYVRGTVDLKGPSRTTTADAGGIQSGVGLRVYF